MVRSLDVPPERLHDVLAHAAVLVGDSQSVTAEAAVLGTPAFRINSWAGRTPLTDLSAKYEVTHSFLPEEIDAALEAIEAALDPAAKEEWGRRRDVMLADKVNLTDWYWDLVHEIAG